MAFEGFKMSKQKASLWLGMAITGCFYHEQNKSEKLNPLYKIDQNSVFTINKTKMYHLYHQQYSWKSDLVQTWQKLAVFPWATQIKTRSYYKVDQTQCLQRATQLKTRTFYKVDQRSVFTKSNTARHDP